MNHLWLYIGLAWLIIGLITTVYGCVTCKAMSDDLVQDEIDARISWFTEPDHVRFKREMYVQRRQVPEPLDRLALAIKRERDELYAVRK